MFILNSFQTLKSLIFGYVSPKYLSGPVGIVTMSYRIIKDYPLVYYMNFIGLISACIAVFNALPLLPFDGGHIVFLIIEKVKGSPINEKVQLYFLYAGLIAVLAFALYNLSKGSNGILLWKTDSIGLKSFTNDRSSITSPAISSLSL